MTGYTWDYEKLKIKLKLKKNYFTSSKSEIPSVLLHDYLGFIVNSVTHLKCQGYCNIICNKIVNYLVIIQVGKRTSASLSELSEQKQILIIKGLICIVKLSDMLLLQ